MSTISTRLVVFFLALVCCVSAATPQFRIGIGKADITGPAADVNMMGYAHPDQRTAGIHTRLYSRAFITCEINNTDTCNVFVNVDIAMGCTAINLDVLGRLKDEFGDRFTEKNVLLSGTHTHSGPGGYLQYLTFTFTSLGFVNISHECIVQGIVQSIRNADAAMVDGNIYVNADDLYNSNINRSPTAYANNPEEEKRMYSGNTDTMMTVVKFVNQNESDLGLISWFPVHPVSMNNTNHLISSDNKGYASYLTERYYEPGFIAAFPNSNQGDVSPNLNGPRCMDTGLPCDNETSTCNGRAQMCVGSGPGKDMFESTQIIGERQHDKAVSLYDSATEMITGSVGSIHQFVNMSDYEVVMEDGSVVKTCTPAMGYSFAGGTTDGPGFFTFTQGDTEGSPIWDFVRNVLKEPSEEMLECQKPKPVLLPTGEAFRPWQWHPQIVDTQMLRIGNLFIIAAPGEFSTMAGRRLRNGVRQNLTANGVPSNATVVITGLSNTYTHYITTPEEYAIQRYEGASTIYGPNTLMAYIQQYQMLTDNLVNGNEDVEAGPLPPNLLPIQRGIMRPTRDSLPDGIEAGSIYIDVDPKYRQGSVVTATFWAVSPRNDPVKMLGDTFLTVERGTGLQREVFYTDNDWCTRFYWERDHNGHITPWQATVYWEIPMDEPLGTYRLCHFGYTKLVTFTLPYDGCSSYFDVVGSDYGQPITTHL
ncbi:putative neutral ceramidase C [Diadema setosum]|uniref:putative neutral ceramidase C n=1 Tax=Diadema setosum TaxID=31175 RepID=UPI003B3B9846